jgi:hypothetical protein
MPQQPEQFQEFDSFSPHGEERGQRPRVSNHGRARGTARAASFETAGESRPLRMRRETAGESRPFRMRRECVRALRLLCLLAMGTMLAACGRCGDFLGSSQSQIGACHSDSPPPH